MVRRYARPLTDWVKWAKVVRSVARRPFCFTSADGVEIPAALLAQADEVIE